MMPAAIKITANMCEGLRAVDVLARLFQPLTMRRIVRSEPAKCLAVVDCLTEFTRYEMTGQCLVGLAADAWRGSALTATALVDAAASSPHTGTVPDARRSSSTTCLLAVCVSTL